MNVRSGLEIRVRMTKVLPNVKLNQAFPRVLAVTGGKFADITLIGKGTVC